MNKMEHEMRHVALFIMEEQKQYLCQSEMKSTKSTTKLMIQPASAALTWIKCIFDGKIGVSICD